MKGWVYVITNKAMPDLVKIGFSTKDPELRAEELNHTGAPHPYQVEYDILIDEPRDFEQAAHSKLRDCREGKEWFRCTPERAIVAIKEVVGEVEHLENFRRIDREKSEQLAQTIKAEKEAVQLRQEAQEKRRREVINRYHVALEAELPNRNFWADFFLVLFGSCFLIALVFQEISDSAFIMLALASSFVVTPIVRGHFSEKAKHTPRYKELVQKRDAELAGLELPQPNKVVKSIVTPPASISPKPAISSHIAPRASRIDLVTISCVYCGESSEHPDVHMISCPRCKRTIFTR